MITPAPYSINIKGELFLFDRPKVMGIINVTPDSFFDGGEYNSVDSALKQAEKHLEEGADFLDIGGFSSRPGADDVSFEEELKRIITPIEAIAKEFPKAIISIDTFRAKVAESAINSGAHIVNDISAGEDDEAMFGTISKLQVPYIIMHKQGSPKTMQQNPEYGNVVVEVAKYLSQRILKLNELGVNDIIADPGFGFGKTVEHNYELLNQLDHFHYLDVPILAGVSRKSMINKVLGTKPENALNGTTVLNTIALQKGAHILRVHDVKEAVQAVKLLDMMK
ncbi:MAG: dihydropteroate synthase [Bacteroidia bacterium]